MFRIGCVAAIAVWCGCGGSQHVAPRRTPSVVVLDPGAEPRRRVRYELTPHVAERFEVDVKLTVNTAFTNTVLENGKRLVDFPTVRYIVRTEVSELTTAGDALQTEVIEDVSTQDDVVDLDLRRRLDSTIAKAKGQRVSWRMAPSGDVADLKLDAPVRSSAERDRLSELLEAVTPVVFPDVDIGAGASWQVRSELSIGGIRWQRTVTYHLNELTDSTATVEAMIEGRAGSQALSVEPNASTLLTSATAHATSDLVIPLHQLAATGRSQGTSETNLQIVRGHLRITSTVTTETITSVTRLSE